jgi:hypothetical protein
MKKLFLVMALGGFGLATAHAQSAPATTAAPTPTQVSPSTAAHPQMQAPMTADLVPDVVKSKFATDYPTVKDAHWRKMGNNYQVYFKENNNTGNVMYSATGAFLRSIRQVDVSALPKAANDYLAKNNTGQPVKIATEIKDATGNTRYQVMANGKGLSFDAKGNLLTPPNMPARTPVQQNVTPPKQ